MLFAFSWGRQIVKRVWFWWKLRLQEQWEGTKGSLLGQQSVMGRPVTRVSKGLAMKRHRYIAEGDLTSPWAAQLRSLCRTTHQQRGAGWPDALNHWQRQSGTQDRSDWREPRFITIQYFSLLKIKWHVRENKRGLTGGGEPMHSQFSLQGWVDEWFKYSNSVFVVEAERLVFCRSCPEAIVTEVAACRGYRWTSCPPGARSAALAGMQPAPTNPPVLGAASLGSDAGCLWAHQPLGFASERGWVRFCVCNESLELFINTCATGILVACEEEFGGDLLW